MKEDSFLDNVKELVSGGYIMLFIFGATLCFMASTSLIGIMLLEAKVGPNITPDLAMAMFNAKIGLFKEIIVGLMGFLAGAYTTMWNNQHFKTEQKKENGNGQNTTTVSTSDNATVAINAGPSTGGDQP